MASEAQYSFFRSLYDEENGRYGLLESRARLYITILTFYIGALAFKIEDVGIFLEKFHVPTALALVSALFFLFSLAFCVYAVRIKNFEGLADPEELIASWPSTPMSDGTFRDDRIADLAIATNRNSLQNDQTARAVTCAGWFLFAGIAVQILIFMVAAYQ